MKRDQIVEQLLINQIKERITEQDTNEILNAYIKRQEEKDIKKREKIRIKGRNYTNIIEETLRNIWEIYLPSSAMVNGIDEKVVKFREGGKLVTFAAKDEKEKNYIGKVLVIDAVGRIIDERGISSPEGLLRYVENRGELLREGVRRGDIDRVEYATKQGKEYISLPGAKLIEKVQQMMPDGGMRTIDAKLAKPEPFVRQVMREARRVGGIEAEQKAMEEQKIKRRKEKARVGQEARKIAEQQEREKKREERAVRTAREVEKRAEQDQLLREIRKVQKTGTVDVFREKERSDFSKFREIRLKYLASQYKENINFTKYDQMRERTKVMNDVLSDMEDIIGTMDRQRGADRKKARGLKRVIAARLSIKQKDAEAEMKLEFSKYFTRNNPIYKELDRSALNPRVLSDIVNKNVAKFDRVIAMNKMRGKAPQKIINGYNKKQRQELRNMQILLSKKDRAKELYKVYRRVNSAYTFSSDLDKTIITELIAAKNIAIFFNTDARFYKWDISAEHERRNVVCMTCLERANGGYLNQGIYPRHLIYQIKELHIPKHPYCLCTWIPLDEDDERVRTILEMNPSLKEKYEVSMEEGWIRKVKNWDAADIKTVGAIAGTAATIAGLWWAARNFRQVQKAFPLLKGEELYGSELTKELANRVFQDKMEDITIEALGTIGEDTPTILERLQDIKEEVNLDVLSERKVEEIWKMKRDMPRVKETIMADRDVVQKYLRMDEMHKDFGVDNYLSEDEIYRAARRYKIPISKTLISDIRSLSGFQPDIYRQVNDTLARIVNLDSINDIDVLSNLETDILDTIRKVGKGKLEMGQNLRDGVYYDKSNVRYSSLKMPQALSASILQGAEEVLNINQKERKLREALNRIRAKQLGIFSEAARKEPIKITAEQFIAIKKMPDETVSKLIIETDKNKGLLKVLRTIETDTLAGKSYEEIRDNIVKELRGNFISDFDLQKELQRFKKQSYKSLKKQQLSREIRRRANQIDVVDSIQIDGIPTKKFKKRIASIKSEQDMLETYLRDRDTIQMLIEELSKEDRYLDPETHRARRPEGQKTKAKKLEELKGQLVDVELGQTVIDLKKYRNELKDLIAARNKKVKALNAENNAKQLERKKEAIDELRGQLKEKKGDLKNLPSNSRDLYVLVSDGVNQKRYMGVLDTKERADMVATGMNRGPVISSGQEPRVKVVKIEEGIEQLREIIKQDKIDVPGRDIKLKYDFGEDFKQLWGGGDTGSRMEILMRAQLETEPKIDELMRRKSQLETQVRSIEKRIIDLEEFEPIDEIKVPQSKREKFLIKEIQRLQTTTDNVNLLREQIRKTEMAEFRRRDCENKHNYIQYLSNQNSVLFSKLINKRLTRDND